MRLIGWHSCLKCGEKRIEKLPFCQGCGKAFSIWPAVTLMLGVIVIAGLLLWFFMRSPVSEPHKGTTRAGISMERSTKTVAKKDPTQILARVDALLKDPQAQSPQIREAIALLDGLLQTYPKFAYGLRLKASLLGILRDDVASTKALQAYLDIVPHDAYARLSLAQAWMKLGANSKALKEAEILYEQYPQFIGLLRVLQKTHESMGHSEMATFYKTELLKAQAEDRSQGQPSRVYHPKDPTKKNAPE